MELEKMTRAELDELQEGLADLLFEVSVEKVRRGNCACDLCRPEVAVPSSSQVSATKVVIHE